MSMYPISVLVLSLVILAGGLPEQDSDVELNVQDPKSVLAYNEQCCAQGLSCCIEVSNECFTQYQFKAFMVDCVTENSQLGADEACPSFKRSEIAENENADVIPTKKFEVVNCLKKIKLIVKMNNIKGMTNCSFQYLKIDHVLDNENNEKKLKLMFPYYLKLIQEPTYQVYDLNFQTSVNAKAYEKIYSKKDTGYKGCITDSNNGIPTCFLDKTKQVIDPYSTGFCCSCENEGEFIPEEKVQLMNDLYTTNSFTEETSTRKNKSIVVDIEDDVDVKVLNKKSSEYDKLGHILQKRGEFDCNDTYSPPGVDPTAYQQSTHCLEFTNVWYNVYDLSKPSIDHKMQVQIFQRYENLKSQGCRDITGTLVNFSNDQFQFINARNSMVINYKPLPVSDDKFSLNCEKHKLLVPDLSEVELNEHPELQGGPKEYLVINLKKIDVGGDKCDVAGVGYEAFLKQPDRCGVKKGTCLKNQPAEMWQHDIDAEKEGRPGKYFLKYFADIPESPILNNITGNNGTLKLYHSQDHMSILEIEFRADDNFVLGSDASTAVILEMYVESIKSNVTIVTVKVFNSGLTPTILKVGITNCPNEIPASFNNILTKPALIPPQHIHVFILQIECQLPNNYFFCSMQVYDTHNKVVAARSIRFHKWDWCICLGHCCCTCLLADGSLKCSPINLEEFRLAGYQGSEPAALQVINFTSVDQIMALMFYIFIFLCMMLFGMGVIKAFLGLISSTVGLWGLDGLLDLPKPIDKYYENELKNREVKYSRSGWPVHPDTGKRMRNIALPTEFCANIAFFLVYPFAVIWSVIKRLCFATYPENPPETFVKCKCGDEKFQKKGCNVQNSMIRRTKPKVKKTKNSKPSKESKQSKEPKEEEEPREEEEPNNDF